MSWSGTRAALRIARRDALRAKGRSLLVVGMIGLPMLAMAFADVAVRSGQLPPAEEARRAIGTADLVADAVSTGSVTQTSRNDYAADAGPPATPPTAAEVAALLPAGSRVVVRDEALRVAIGAGDRVVLGAVRHYDLADPLARGVTRLRHGTYPRTDGEAAITVKAARTLGVHVGDAVRLGDPARPFRVSAIVVDPSSLSERAAYVLPSAAVATRANAAFDAFPAMHGFAVDLPPGARDLDVMAVLNAHGFRVSPRTWFFQPPPRQYDSGVDAQAAGLVVLVVGLATLEVVLLAGTAFAVGARRRTRELALVAATGGDRKDVRRIVLAGAVVLGAVAGLVGIAGGIALAVLARPIALDRLSGSLAGPLDVRTFDLGVIVLVAIGTALLAAVTPAVVAARQQVVAALTGRQGQMRTRRRVPVIALLAIAGGTALAFWAAGSGFTPARAGSTVVGADSGRATNFSLLLTGSVVAELGFVGCAPSLVGLVGRLARRFPLSLRLAARDAARHRARSGPAVAAVVAAVAGSVAISVYASSDAERQRRAYEPRLPVGVVEVIYKPRHITDSEVARLSAALPVEERVDLAVAGTFCAEKGTCPVQELEPASPADRCPDPAPDAPPCRVFSSGSIGVGTPALAAVYSGHDDPAVAAAMRAGAVAVFDRRWISDGHVTVVTRDGPDGPVSRLRLPAVLASRTATYDRELVAVLTPETARRSRLPYVTIATLFTTTRTPTTVEEAKAQAIEGSFGVPGGVYVERGFVPKSALPLLVLLGISAVITLGATAIATGLAATDSRPDLATLAAVGAGGGVRRRLAMAQAATVAGLGSVLGILAGMVPALTVISARAEMPIALPYRMIATTALGVPLVAALLVGLVTRSRLPMRQRLV